MNPQTLDRLKKARDAGKANWVQVSADDVVEASSAGEADDVTARLKKAAERALEGRVLTRRNKLPMREIFLARKDLEHLIVRAEPLSEPDPEPQAKGGVERGEASEPQPDQVPQEPKVEEQKRTSKTESVRSL